MENFIDEASSREGGLVVGEQVKNGSLHGDKEFDQQRYHNGRPIRRLGRDQPEIQLRRVQGQGI